MNYNAVFIDLLTVCLAVALVIIGLVLPQERRKATGFIAIPSLVVILIISFFLQGNEGITFFNGLYVSDALSTYLKQIFLVGAILVSILSLTEVERFKDNKGEFFALIVFALSGMMILASSNDFITLYIGLELMTIAMIIMTSYQKQNIKSSEAGIKYLLLSAISSGVLLYGISLLYGLSGSLNFAEIVKHFETSEINLGLVVAVIMILAGFGFKISAVPFHMWSPDVYEGAPTAVTAFLAVGSKAAGFAMILRVFFQALPTAFQPFIILVVVLACMTMILGNLVAIPQKNIKRMLAYSSISHAGYILLGLVAFTKMGVGSILFYLLLYIFANIGAFAAVMAVSGQSDSNDISDFAGMWKRSPFITGVLLLSLLSLAGIPPAAGFIGKFFLFRSIIQEGYIWLAFLAIAMSVVSIYYYINVIRVMLIGEAASDTAVRVPVHLKLVMILSAAMTLFMGIYPGPMLEWANNVASQFIK